METTDSARIEPGPHPHISHCIRIGCAGWSIPGEHRHLFSGAGSVLERYASRLDGVEINSSFYRPHQPKTYARWASSVPETFRFSVKVPKAITHEGALVGTAPLVDRFLGECLELGNRLGGLLVQLPPGLHFDAGKANAFFGLLRRRLPDEVAIACEPRHASWFDPKTQAIWSRYDVNRIGADPSPVTGADASVPLRCGQWRYWRLHGSPRRYYSAYSHEFLAKLVPLLKQAAQTRDVWVIFDNTAQGHAVADALKLQRLVA
jgi:uncharacterized protein YecE (DUF72 family)